jgi:hypothetical protein
MANRLRRSRDQGSSLRAWSTAARPS